jgi:hypothetical protein
VLDASLQRCPLPADPSHPPEPEGVRPGIVPDALGARSVVGEGFHWRCEDDQRKVGNSGHEARIPRCLEIPEMPDSRRRFLRVAEDRESEAAVLL